MFYLIFKQNTQANSLVKIKGENFCNIRNAMQEHYRCDALRKTRERAKRAFKGGVLGVGVLGGKLKPLSIVNLYRRQRKW